MYRLRCRHQLPYQHLSTAVSCTVKLVTCQLIQKMQQSNDREIPTDDPSLKIARTSAYRMGHAFCAMHIV